ncbi:erythroid differentiation-related factor 1 [Hermetia illucens]|uniref:erythroid differentiation-related factor 1 n=1 Tax=Hermetia illucens TaxID=343691 RepID=UPI0018CC4C93|nr:erythroid differentiation-related factor 1 [Hermetia illucens]
MDDTNVDEIELCQSVEPHNDGELIKSKAVVKFSAVQVPAQFTRLQCNTDLNMPPSNWLSGSASSYGLQQFIYHSTGFASFRMAHKFPDCLGEVDVVSDAENIKNLLKLPYSPKNAISMMVHRIGNTLLIDEFDLQKYLLRQADDDWKWLRTFIVEHILTSLNEKDRNFFCIKDKSRGAIQRKNLLSKFLYHSLQHVDTDISNSEPANTTGERPLPLTGPILPEPDIEENVPDPNSNHVFNRNVVWTFEDIRMLIGTDMPIFGGGTRPCISLRLRDMAKPISVLTGIDYWLDNLMCNVPEVVMCYHLDGIVQKYEIIKTEDLPYLEDSQFSPQVVRNVAQNILAFLKSNATKAGHTYWLFKGRNDDVVKLYDLTTLCQNEECDEKSENPFTVPVAMLLYTVARNMRNASAKIGQKKAGSIKVLLENCIQLLPKEKYPQIVTSSHYILSDLHIPAYIDPKAPDFDCSDDDDSQSVYDEDYCPSEYDEPDETNSDVLMRDTNVVMKNICETLKDFNLEDNRRNTKLPLPLVATIEERCRIALHHVHSGLDCLQYFALNEEEMTKKKEERAKEEEKQRIIHEEQNPNMAKPFQPIPLPYESLKPEPKMANPEVPIPLDWDEERSTNKRKKKSKQKGRSKNSVKETPVAQKSLVQENTKIGNSWNVHLKLLLIEKACLTYATLAEYYYNLEHFGTSLRYIYMALRCQKVVTTYVPPASSQRNCLLGRAGDAFFQLSKNWEQISDYIEEFNAHDELDDSILLELEKDLQENDNEYIVPMENIEGLSLQSIKFYELALECTPDNGRTEILRRLGSVRNELGLKYMNWGKNEYEKFLESLDGKEESQERTDRLYEVLTFKSYDCFIRAIAAFEEVNDDLNVTYVYCNLGRFMRYRAHIHIHGERPDDLRNQKKFYNEAFSCYSSALAALGSRKNHPDTWDAVEWEFATATFSLAQLMQDYGDLSSFTAEELEKETVSLLQESLKFCKGEHCASQELLYKYRSGLIHHRLASFHHCVYRRTSEEGERRRSLQLAFLHYGKAVEILESLGEVADYLKSQIKQISLTEQLAESQTGVQKIRTLHKALNLILNSRQMILAATDQDIDLPKIILEVRLFEERLQHILRNLTKICSPDCKDSSKLAASYTLYKALYATTLKKKPTDDRQFLSYFAQLLTQLINVGGEKVKNCLI